MNKLVFAAVAALALAGCETVKESDQKLVERLEQAVVRLDNQSKYGYRHELGRFYYSVPLNMLRSKEIDAKNGDNECLRNTSDGSNGNSWQRYLTKVCGLEWPQGSECEYVKHLNVLRIKNTWENLEAFQSFLDHINILPCYIDVRLRFVGVEQKTLDEIGAELFPGRPAGYRYDVSEFESVPAEELERRLVSRRDLVYNLAPKLRTQPGEEAVVKTVTECIYPTDYEVKIGEMPACDSNKLEKVRQSGFAAVEPQSFTMREAGVILDVVPTKIMNGTKVLLKVNSCYVEDPTWKDYGMNPPSVNGGVYRMPMEQPFFPVHSLDSEYCVTLGETMLVDYQVRSREKDMTILVFLHVDGDADFFESEEGKAD